jgi:hypothetical protein
VKVELSDRALLKMQRIDVSWRKRASSPDVFLDELEELVRWIETTGVIGPVCSRTGFGPAVETSGPANCPRPPFSDQRFEPFYRGVQGQN